MMVVIAVMTVMLLTMIMAVIEKKVMEVVAMVTVV